MRSPGSMETFNTADLHRLSQPGKMHILENSNSFDKTSKKHTLLTVKSSGLGVLCIKGSYPADSETFKLRSETLNDRHYNNGENFKLKENFNCDNVKSNWTIESNTPLVVNNST